MPATLELTGVCHIEAEAAPIVQADGAPAQPALPRFRMVAYTGGPMRLAGWRHPVVVDLAGMSIPTQMRPIRSGHDSTQGVGHSDSIRVESGTLVASGVVSRDTAAAREVVISSRNGFPWQASIGASVDEFEFVREGQVATANGRSFAGPVNVVRKSTLGEISFVELGADGNTSARIAASLQHPDSQEKNMSDTASNTPAPTTSPTAASVTAEHTTVTAAAPGTLTGAPDRVQQIRAEAAAESQRIGTIRKLCAGRHVEIEAKAIAEG